MITFALVPMPYVRMTSRVGVENPDRLRLTVRSTPGESVMTARSGRSTRVPSGPVSNSAGRDPSRTSPVSRVPRTMRSAPTRFSSAATRVRVPPVTR